ncbi:MAG: CIA30 family protein [Gammaproteobacteria bacterium]|nr:CIA30 family protein [Gammaproteobacteria bacterium]MDX2460347.1 CIA30 family protein [Gammaproteobacteria bacterium]
MLIDDFTDENLISKRGTRWRAVSDQVMGGISKASVAYDIVDGRPCLRLSGDVRVENNGGFVQAALDLQLHDDTRSDTEGDPLDVSGYTGVRLVVRGNGEKYSVHLRTLDNVRPWQSYRAHFTAGTDWQTIDLPFETFESYRLETPLDVTSLRRIGLVAIGRAFHADLAVCKLAFYR